MTDAQLKYIKRCNIYKVGLKITTKVIPFKYKPWLNMKPINKLKIIENPKKFQGVFSNIYICSDEEKNLFLFKYIQNKKIIYNEVLAWKIAPLAKVSTIPYPAEYSSKEKKGIILTYLKEAKPLNQYKKKLNSNQLNELQRIILFDLFIGNRDRHTANILVHENNLIPVDHGKILQEKQGKGIRFIKLDLGLKLNPKWPDIIEKLKGMSTISALIKLGFNKRDIKLIENIRDAKMRKITSNSNTSNFLHFRRNNFTKLDFY